MSSEEAKAKLKKFDDALIILSNKIMEACSWAVNASPKWRLQMQADDERDGTWLAWHFMLNPWLTEHDCIQKCIHMVADTDEDPSLRGAQC